MGLNKLHSLEQQLARWLLTMNDYVGDELRLTHDLMALHSECVALVLALLQTLLEIAEQLTTGARLYSSR